MDIEGDIVVEGLRSDYYVAFTPNHSWDDAIQIIRKKIEEFNPRGYIPREYQDDRRNKNRVHTPKIIYWRISTIQYE